MKSELRDLRTTLESLREHDHADIPQTLVSRIIDAESANPEDESAALREVRLAIDDYLREDEES